MTLSDRCEAHSSTLITLEAACTHYIPDTDRQWIVQ